MYETFQKEQFSRAYIYAVAAKTGCNVCRWDVDDDSVDCSLKYKITGRPQVDVQVKCTINLRGDGEVYTFVLDSIKNYNELRDSNLCVPKILVIVGVPQEIDDWLEQDHDKLLLRKCAYWVDLRGKPPTNNTCSISISVPKSNMFTPDALKAMMENVASRGAI